MRRAVHRHPEEGLELPDTQAAVLRTLDGLPLRIHTGHALSSVVAVLAGTAPGPVVLLRADMDALPLTERTGLAFGGYRCTYGTSFVMAVELTDDGPVGVGLLAYGQSGDARSPHHRDGTDAYAAKQPRPLLFTDEAIAADPNLVERTVTS